MLLLGILAGAALLCSSAFAPLHLPASRGSSRPCFLSCRLAGNPFSFNRHPSLGTILTLWLSGNLACSSALRASVPPSLRPLPESASRVRRRHHHQLPATTKLPRWTTSPRSFGDLCPLASVFSTLSPTGTPRKAAPARPGTAASEHNPSPFASRFSQASTTTKHKQHPVTSCPRRASVNHHCQMPLLARPASPSCPMGSRRSKTAFPSFNTST